MKDESRDPEGKNLVRDLAKELRLKKTKFTDPFFPPNASSLFVDPTRRSQEFLEGHQTRNIVWKRPSELAIFQDKAIKVACVSHPTLHVQ